MVLFSHILEICQTVCLLLPYASDNNVDIIVDILLIHCRCHVVMKSKRPIQCRENVVRMLFQHSCWRYYLAIIPTLLDKSRKIALNKKKIILSEYQSTDYKLLGAMLDQLLDPFFMLIMFDCPFKPFFKKYFA